MDFTAAYGHAGADTVCFSPGSTFIAYVDGEQKSTVIVRVSGTLQVVRSWELATPLQSLAWSPDGLFLLVNGYTGRGVSFVLPLDPDACVTDGSDDNQGWVARIEGGVAGVAHAQWVPVWRVPSVAQLSHDAGGMVYALADQSFTTFPGTVLLNLHAPPHTERFGVVQRARSGDCIALYAPASQEAPSLERPVEWALERVRTNVFLTLVNPIAYHRPGWFGLEPQRSICGRVGRATRVPRGRVHARWHAPGHVSDRFHV